LVKQGQRAVFGLSKYAKLELPFHAWAKAASVALLLLVLFVAVITVADSIGLFYLYSFDRDPKGWSNLIHFYGRPKRDSREKRPPDSASIGTLVVRGNDGLPAYASHHDLGLEDIKPSALHDCLLAAEDKRFYRHTGTDYFGMARALFDRFVSGSRLRGASTISNQLIGEVILADRSRDGARALWRKLEEIILTGVAERHFSKDDLLLAYVNNVPVGHLNGLALIGLSAASEALFGKRYPKSLTLSEACTVAGMLNRPNRYIAAALKGEYSDLQKRRNSVLDNLRGSNPTRYSDETIARAKKEEIRFFKKRRHSLPEFRQFISYAYQQLPSKRPGLRIYLTLDEGLQRAAEASINEELARFDRGPYGFYNLRSYNYAIEQGRGVTAEESKLQAALVALDAKTGEILAMVGGRAKSEFNRATQAKRAPGSLIKPFVYLYGINYGSYAGQRFRADTIIDPSRHPMAQRYTTEGAAPAIVQLARSDNGAAVAIADEFGISRIQQFVVKVTGANPVASELLAIGGGKGIELTPLEVASAYTVFPNSGEKMMPSPIRALYDHEKSLETPEHKPVGIVHADATLTVTHMLRAVIGDGPYGQYGTAKMARKLSGLDSSVSLAGKTGTGDSDLWFVGFTPRIVVVVWVGFDNNYPSFEAAKGFTGSGLPLQIWGRFMRDVKRYRPEFLEGKFEMPPADKEFAIDPAGG
jgi:membrane peptidoglycan carboxypeptidase